MIKKISLLIFFLVVITSAGYWIYQSKSEGPTEAEKSCLGSGGQVSVSSCCKSIGDFPNFCLVGSCGCSPTDSREVKSCDCGNDKCFDGKECVQQQLLITIYCVDNNCSAQQISQGAGTLVKGCYRDLNECFSSAGTKEITLCTQEQRSGDVCFEIYDPVCAKVDIQCIKAPCNPVYQTFSNACEACRNSLVESYVEGECLITQ
jgi:hypothetical protein